MPVPIEDLDKRIQTDPDYAKMNPTQQVEFAKRVYQAEGYGSDVPTAGIKTGSQSPGAQMMMESVLPAVGTVAGGVSGTALKTALGIKRLVGPLLATTEGAGSAAGEYVNQKLGISEPSDLALGVSAIAPAIGRMLPGAVQHLPQLLPGSAASIRSGIADTARFNLPGLIKAPDSKALYTELANTPTPTRVTQLAGTRATVQRLKDEIAKNPSEEVRRLAKDNLGGLLDSLETVAGGSTKTVQTMGPGGKPFSKVTGLPGQKVTTPPGFSFDEARQTVETIGQAMRSTTNPGLRGQYKQLYKSLLTDLEKMPASAGQDIATWQKARVAYKKEIAKTDLSEAIEKSITTVEGVDQFHADRVMNWLRKNPDFKARIDPKEYAQIESTLRNLGSFTGKRSNKLLSMIVGASLDGGAAGAAVGYVAADKIAEALLKPNVRRAMARWATAGEGKVAQDMSAVITAGLAGALD